MGVNWLKSVAIGVVCASNVNPEFKSTTLWT